MSIRPLRRALAVGAVSVLALAACGDDESSGDVTTAAEHDHDEAASDTTAAEHDHDEAATGEHDHDEAATDTTSADTVAANGESISIDIDADAAEAGTQTVAAGTTVSLHITAAESHPYHLHGYDIEQEGAEVTITFVADRAGSFDVETHDTDTKIFTLVVE
jgi:hypothetical protein